MNDMQKTPRTAALRDMMHFNHSASHEQVVSSMERSQENEGLLDNHGKGLSLWVAAIFIVGQMAGSGVLALPQALANTGWAGVPLIILCCINASYGGICLARCWLILEERWEEYRVPNRYPYPNIGYRAMGKWMRYCVSVCMDFTVFGAGTVFLLLCAQLMCDLVGLSTGLNTCHWVMILAAVQCPIMCLGTPKEFWGAAAAALISTTAACILILANIGKDVRAGYYPPSTFPSPTTTNFFLAFGTILFAYGGTCAFPTFQNDMKDKQKFSKAVVIGMALLVLLYLPVSITAYAVIGGDVQENVMKSLSEGLLRQIVDALLAGHLFFAFVIVVNPFVQELDEFFKVQNSFNLKRCILRIFYMATTAFIAESVPSFSKILNLLGGSTITLLAFVFPPIFYVKLCRDKSNPLWKEWQFQWWEYALLPEVVLVGVAGGVASTYSALKEIVDPEAFTPPCYLPSHNTTHC